MIRYDSDVAAVDDVVVAVAINAAVVNETAYTRDQSCHPELNTQFDWRGAIP